MMAYNEMNYLRFSYSEGEYPIKKFIPGCEIHRWNNEGEIRFTYHGREGLSHFALMLVTRGMGMLATIKLYGYSTGYAGLTEFDGRITQKLLTKEELGHLPMTLLVWIDKFVVDELMHDATRSTQKRFSKVTHG